MNPELEKLIDMAVADGAVTDKEREILLRKAEKLGEDKDEVEMILDGKIALQKQNKGSAKPASDQDTPIKEGVIVKCPSCGENSSSFETLCKSCGYEYKGKEASNTVTDLFNHLNEIDEIESKKKKNFFGETKEGGVSAADQKIQIIKNFPVPNTREEILELIYFIRPKVEEVLDDQNEQAIQKAWITKYREIILRAKSAFANEKDMYATILEFEKPLLENSFLRSLKNNRVLIGSLVGLFFVMAGLFFLADKENKEFKEGISSETMRLESIIAKVNDAIENKAYDNALVLASQIKWEYVNQKISDDIEKLIQLWNEKRERLIDQINLLKSQEVTNDFSKAVTKETNDFSKTDSTVTNDFSKADSLETNDFSKAVTKETMRLESIITKVNEAIENKAFDNALLLSSQIKWEYDDKSVEFRAVIAKFIRTWNRKKENLINQINVLKSRAETKEE